MAYSIVAFIRRLNALPNNFDVNLTALCKEESEIVCEHEKSLKLLSNKSSVSGSVYNQDLCRKLRIKVPDYYSEYMS